VIISIIDGRVPKKGRGERIPRKGKEWAVALAGGYLT
jgi:hypothetical protein